MWQPIVHSSTRTPRAVHVSVFLVCHRARVPPTPSLHPHPASFLCADCMHVHAHAPRYVGRHAGYLQVTRASGAGPVLLVIPDGDGHLDGGGDVHAGGGGDLDRGGGVDSGGGFDGGGGFEAWSPLRKGETRDSNDWMHESLYAAPTLHWRHVPCPPHLTSIGDTWHALLTSPPW